MKRLYIVGDPHFSETRLIDNRGLVNQTLEHLEKYKPDYVIILGDLLDTHRVMRLESYNLALFWLEELSKICKTIILKGNHEGGSPQDLPGIDDHTLRAFKHIPNVKIVDEPFRMDIGGYDCVFMPYVPPGYFKKYLKKYFGDEALTGQIYFGHQGFRGAKLDNMQEDTTGDKWGENLPLMITGHYHKRQRVNENLYYPGSAGQISFGEEGEEKSVLLLDLDEKMTMKEIPLTFFEPFETLTIDVKEEFDLEKNPKKRYVLVNGSAGELSTFFLKHKNVLGTKVEFRPTGTKEIIAQELIDPFVDLREQLTPELLEFLESLLSQEVELSKTKIKLPTPKRNMILKIDSYLYLKDLEITLSKNITALRGKNGAGKSSVLNAVEYLFYGGQSPLDKSKISLSCKKWAIERTSSPRKITVQIGEDVYTNESAQAIIEATFGTHDLWKISSFLGQKQHNHFFSLTDREKKEFLATLFSSVDYQRLGVKINELETTTKKNYEIAKRDLDNFLSTIEGLNLEATHAPTFDDLIELPKPEVLTVERTEPTKPTLLDYPKDEELELLEVPTYDKTVIEKKKKELEGYRKNQKEAYQIGEKIKLDLRRKELKEQIIELKSQLLDEDEIKKLISYRKTEKEYQSLDVEPDPVLDFDEVEEQTEKYRLVEKHQKKFKVLPTFERKKELEHILETKDGKPTHCPECSAELLAFVKKDSVELQKRKGKYVPIDQKLIEEYDSLKNMIIVEKPRESLEILRQQRRKFELGKIPKRDLSPLENQKKIETKIEILVEELAEIPNIKLTENLLPPEEYSPLIENLIREIENLSNIEKQVNEIIKINQQRKTDHQNVQKQKRKMIDEQNEQLEKKYHDQLTEYQAEVSRKEKENANRLLTWKKENQRRIDERKRREVEYQTQIERLSKIKTKKENDEKKIAEIEKNLTMLKDLFLIFKKVESATYQRQLLMWNELYDSVVSRFFEGGSGKISAYKETKSSLADRITVETEIDGKKKIDLRASGGEKDLISLALMLSVSALTSSTFRIILLDEILGDIAVDKATNLIIPALTELLAGSYVLFCSHDEYQAESETIEL